MVGPIDEFDSRVVARRVNSPGLVIHDRGDRQVPYEHGQGIADAWPGAELVTIEGLGHRRMLTNPDVIGRVIGFVDAQRYTSPARASRA
jgi:pimeloyl-ACP methyl ester carboxylesterase